MPPALPDRRFQRSCACLAVILAAVVSCSEVLGLEPPAQISLGASCDGSNGGDVARCPLEAGVCTSLTGSAYFCTASCGNGAPGSGADAPVPPASGDAICQSLVSFGTPVCALYGAEVNGIVPWWCATLCGSIGSADLGDCPPGLTCISNACQ